MRRVANPIESFYNSRYGCAIAWSMRGPVTPNLLCSSLDYLGTIHPVLRSEMVKNSENKTVWQPFHDKKWYSFDPISTTIHFPKSQLSTFTMDRLENTFSIPFTSGGPIARISLVENPENEEKCEVVLNANHGHVDGRSIALLLEQLVYSMACLKKGIDPNLRKYDDIQTVDAQILKGNPDAPSKVDIATLPFFSKVPSKERKWATIYFELNDISALAKACKSNSVTMNSIILAALLESFDKECKRVGHINPSTNLVITVVDTASEYSNQQISSAHIVALPTYIEKSAAPNVWELAKQYNKKVKTGVTERKWRDNSKIQDAVFSHEFSDANLFEVQGRASSQIMSNLGDLNKFFGKQVVWSHPPFHVETAVVQANQQTFGTCLSAVGFTYNGKLCLSVGFCIPTYDKAFIQQIANTAEGILRKAA